MKKWLKRIGIGLSVVFLSLAALIVLDHFDYQRLTSRVLPSLPLIKPDWPGNPVDQDGRFMNDEYPALPKLAALLKWRLSGNEFEDEKAADKARIPVGDPAAFLASDEDGIMWLGHASMFIRIGGVSILTDPVFGDPPFITRLVPVPSPIAKLKSVDLVLLSHDHRDHTDEATLRAIAAKFPDARFLAGIGTEALIADFAGANRSSTAGWFQQFSLAGKGEVNIYFLPVRHWSRRGLFDTNERLWGGYVIESGDKQIYFGGDSGYGRHYAETGELFPDLDYFIIGIAAYEPRWFMEANHNNPADAVQAFVDSGAKILIPMHYGTFDLSDEPPSAPLPKLIQEAEKVGVAGQIRPLEINGHLPIE